MYVFHPISMQMILQKTDHHSEQTVLFGAAKLISPQKSILSEKLYPVGYEILGLGFLSF